MDKDDDRVGILNAILTNTAIKIVFGGCDPDDRDLLTRVLFDGHIDLCEEKPFYRPVAIGQDKTTVANWSRSEMEAQSLMDGVTRSHAHGSGHATMSSTSSASGSGSGSGESYGQVLTPPFRLFAPNAPDASLFSYPTSQSTGESSSQNAFEMTSQSSGESFNEFDLYGEAHTHARGTSRGTAKSEGQSEVFVTRYQWLAAEPYSLQDQLHRFSGLLATLAQREAFLKIRGQRPVRVRTADLPPAFRSAKFQRLMLPLYRARCAANSPYIKPCDQVDAEIAARFAPVLPKPDKPEPDTWREPFDFPEPPPPPPDVPRNKPKLRVVRPDSEVGE